MSDMYLREAIRDASPLRPMQPERLREEAAMRFMAAMLVRGGHDSAHAEKAVALADALVEALRPKPPTSHEGPYR